MEWCQLLTLIFKYIYFAVTGLNETKSQIKFLYLHGWTQPLLSAALDQSAGTATSSLSRRATFQTEGKLSVRCRQMQLA